MEAGRLRQRVQIQQKVVTRDSFGGEAITWSTLATVWARVSPMSGREQEWFGLETAEMLTTMRMRFYPGVLPKMRCVFESRNYDVLSVKNIDELDREMVLATREVVD